MYSVNVNIGENAMFTANYETLFDLRLIPRDCYKQVNYLLLPIRCSFCESRFIRTANLKAHERIHSVEKPFKVSCIY